ncbi:MAG: hypothetical protein ABIY62_02280 [Ginsengibacter sp.]
MEKNIIQDKTVTAAANSNNYSLPLRIPAQLFSVIFHPLFIPTIATWYLAFVHQGYFIGIAPHEKIMILIRVGYITILYPGLSVLLLKAVGFSKSIFLKTQRERIIPYITANIFYFWMYLVFRNQPEVPTVLTAFIFGIFLSSSIGLIANSYFKISMHGLGMGALSGLIICMIFTGTPYGIFLGAMMVFILSGLVLSSRLIVSDHTPFDIYTGFFFGIICQLISALFISYT